MFLKIKKKVKRVLKISPIFYHSDISTMNILEPILLVWQGRKAWYLHIFFIYKNKIMLKHSPIICLFYINVVYVKRLIFFSTTVIFIKELCLIFFLLKRHFNMFLNRVAITTYKCIGIFLFVFICCCPYQERCLYFNILLL